MVWVWVLEWCRCGLHLLNKGYGYTGMNILYGKGTGYNALIKINQCNTAIS